MNKKIKEFTFGRLTKKKLDVRNIFEDYLKISDEIYKFRVAKGISQKKLAQLAGTTQRIISQIENSEINVGINLFLRISQALDIPFKYGDFSKRERFFAEVKYDKTINKKVLSLSDTNEFFYASSNAEKEIFKLK